LNVVSWSLAIWEDTLSFGLMTLLFMVTIQGKLFTGFIMEITGRRWTITYCFAGAIPDLALMALS